MQNDGLNDGFKLTPCIIMVKHTGFPLLCLSCLFLLTFEACPQCPGQNSSEKHLSFRRIIVSGTRADMLAFFVLFWQLLLIQCNFFL